MRYGIYRSVDGGPWAAWTTGRDRESFENLVRAEGGPLELLFVTQRLNVLETVDEEGVSTLYEVREGASLKTFKVFEGEPTVGLDQLLKRIPAEVDPQDVTLTLVLRGVDTDVEVEFDEGAET